MQHTIQLILLYATRIALFIPFRLPQVERLKFSYKGSNSSCVEIHTFTWSFQFKSEVLCLNYLILLNISQKVYKTHSTQGNTKFWYGGMNLVQMNILEAYAILQYSMIIVAVEIESEVMKF
jgi:hypothetical protein